MDSISSPFPAHLTRLGFHYYPDTLHYRESDLQNWLPELFAMGASWLVLKSPVDRAIPEYFLSALIEAGIEPIIQYGLPLLNPPDPAELKPVLSAYAHWGVRSVVWFDRPNCSKSWTSFGWAQQDLVERFLDRYIPYATLAMQSGLVPVFPPLEPGGSYWDTSFLRTALKSIERRKQTALLDRLVLSAYAWTGDHSLNWGAGGPERWPDARPYGPHGSQIGDEIQDQLGFRIYDWYQDVAKDVLGKKCPVILMGAGTNHDPTHAHSAPLSGKAHTQTNLAIARLLANAAASDPHDSGVLLDPIPPEVVACNLWLLAAPPDSPHYNQAWYRDSAHVPAVDALRTANTRLRESAAAPTPDYQGSNDDPNPEETPGQVESKLHPIHHYLLLPVYDFGVADWHLNIIHPFVKKYRPTVGFSLAEAALAAHVTVIGSPLSISEDKLEQLRMAGSVVERIYGDGMSIASQLAER